MNPRKNVVMLTFVILLNVSNRVAISVDPCIYDVSEKGIIDLTSVGRVDGTPAWKNVQPKKHDKHMYSYNPCKPFTEGSCNNVAGCQTYINDTTLTYSLGSQNSIQWKFAMGQDLPTLQYAAGGRSLSVDLKCLSSGGANKLEVEGESPTTTGLYMMTLSSKCACWNGCKGGHGGNTNDGVSVGAVFLIVVTVIFVIYCIVFMSINKLKRQATGLDILPHRAFWNSLPGYTFDGMRFTFYKITGKGASYTSIP